VYFFDQKNEALIKKPYSQHYLFKGARSRTNEIIT